jgi:hypothetical protein
MIFRASIIWFVILVLAIGNGAVRVMWAIPRMGDTWAHVWSTLTLSLLVLLTAWITMWWVGPSNGREAMVVGALWLGLTVAFEFLGGHYLFKAPWSKLLADYNVINGRIWILVLVTTFLAPWISVVGHKTP